jgi:hypothetical protein
VPPETLAIVFRRYRILIPVMLILRLRYLTFNFQSVQANVETLSSRQDYLRIYPPFTLVLMYDFFIYFNPIFICNL